MGVIHEYSGILNCDCGHQHKIWGQGMRGLEDSARFLRITQDGLCTRCYIAECNAKGITPWFSKTKPKTEVIKMDSIDDLVNQAMAQWDEETNCGETDPAFQGEVGQEIDKLVDGLSPDEAEKLLAEDNPLIFVQSKGE